MKTHVIISTDGETVNDSKALEWAENRIGSSDIVIGTGVMLNAFRWLRVRGDIEELWVTFCNGDTRITNQFAQISDWPSDPVIDTETDLLCKIMGWAHNRPRS